MQRNTHNSFWTRDKFHCLRMYGRGLWLVTIGALGAIRQAHAVVDDFGDLVMVRDWQ